jgi:hypothetical protein
MLQAETQADPLVEILRLAYRRGLVLLQERETEPERQADPKPIESKEKESQNEK